MDAAHTISAGIRDNVLSLKNRVKNEWELGYKNIINKTKANKN